MTDLDYMLLTWGALMLLLAIPTAIGLVVVHRRAARAHKPTVADRMKISGHDYEAPSRATG